MANVQIVVRDAAGYARVIGSGDTPCDGSWGSMADGGAPDWAAITGKPATFPPDPHAHAGSWVTVKLGSDFSTTSTSAQNVTGLMFTPAANTDYEFEAVLMTRTATATVGPRPGLSWPTGLSDGAAAVQQTSSATANVFANGNISGAILTPVGGLPSTTGSWLATIWGICRAGASPSGNVQVQLASETNGTSVTIKAGSLLKYRVV